MTDRLDTIRKRLASGNPFTPHAGDLAWAVGEIERLTKENASLRSQLDDGGFDGAVRVVDTIIAEARAEARAEIARLDALSRATADAEAADDEACS